MIDVLLIQYTKKSNNIKFYLNNFALKSYIDDKYVFNQSILRHKPATFF